MFGEVASQAAVESSMEYICNIKPDLLSSKGSKEIANAIKVANETIITIQKNETKYDDMSSTLSCFLIKHNKLHLAWVGDSRIYLLRPIENSIQMLTTDHTLDQSKIDPTLAPALFKRAPSILTQVVGSILLLKPDHNSNDVRQGDIILACTDGLSNLVPDALILEYCLQQGYTNADELNAFADKLLDRALDCGGHDNISLILAKIN